MYKIIQQDEKKTFLQFSIYKYFNSLLYTTYPTFSGNLKSAYPIVDCAYPIPFLRTLYFFYVPYTRARLLFGFRATRFRSG